MSDSDIVKYISMLSEEEEMSLTRWRDLLGAELAIALEELSKIHKDGANKRHQHYVESCAQQYWTIIARITALPSVEKTKTEASGRARVANPARADIAL